MNGLYDQIVALKWIQANIQAGTRPIQKPVMDILWYKNPSKMSKLCKVQNIYHIVGITISHLLKKQHIFSLLQYLAGP